MRIDTHLLTNPRIRAGSALGRWAGLLVLLFFPETALAFTYDELLPDAIATFVQLQPGGGRYLSNYHKNPAYAVTGNDFPTTWQTLSSGQDLRLRILLPPGVDLAGVTIESPAMVATFGVCDGVPATCATTRASPPMLWPIGSAPSSTLTDPRIVSFIVAAEGAPFIFATMTVTYQVADLALYEAWRSARSWAGGPGDCDGLGGAYCGGAAPPGPPVISIRDVTIREGDAGVSEATLEVELSSPSSLATSVAWSTVDGSARAGLDYVAASGTLVFAPGSTRQGVTVAVLGDRTLEADEVAFVELWGATNGVIGQGRGTLTISDDDAGPPGVADVALTLQAADRLVVGREASAPSCARSGRSS